MKILRSRVCCLVFAMILVFLCLGEASKAEETNELSELARQAFQGWRKTYEVKGVMW